MRWLDLAFLHWEADPDDLRARLPPGLELDLHDGRAWLGIVPFRMEGIAFSPLPPLPFASAFPECNVRTYVRHGDRAGVWFFSLDIPHGPAVWAARTFFHLPYFKARLAVKKDADAIHYRDERNGQVFDATYRAAEPVDPSPGSFADWSTERYCFFSADKRDRLYRGDVRHHRWPLQTAEVTIHENSLLAPFQTGPAHPQALFSESLDVEGWRVVRC